MQIHYEWGPEGAIKASQRGDLCIVVDIFRASSTIVTALASGFDAIEPVHSFIAKTDDISLTVGEVNGIKIPSCDFGNSPTEILNATKRSKNLKLKTSNGTKCLKNITYPDAIVLIGCLLNATMVAKAAAFLSAKHAKDISFILAGKHGAFCEDDHLAGEFITALIHSSINMKSIPDLIYERTKNLLTNSSSAQDLMAIGYADDVKFCVQLDYYTNLPMYNTQTGLISNSPKLQLG